jgi:hypothetical protein
MNETSRDELTQKTFRNASMNQLITPETEDALDESY